MRQKLRVGILGAGWAAQSHATAFAHQPDVAITALWNRTRANAEDMAAKIGGERPQVYDHWQDLVEQADIDLLSVTTAQLLRREPVVAALERGLHLLVEKPLSLELSDAKAMTAAAQKAGTVASICFTTRYAPGIQAALQEVRTGGIGRLLTFQTGWWLGMKPSVLLQSYPWWTDRAAVLTGVGAHEFDRVRFLTGADFARLTGRVVPGILSDEPEQVLPATYSLLADLESGICGEMKSMITPGDSRWEIVLYGERGWLKASNEQAVRQLADESEPTAIEIPAAARLPDSVELFQHNWNQLIADFVTAIRSGDTTHTSAPNLPTLADGLHAQAVAEAALRAEAERRWVEMRELE